MIISRALVLRRKASAWSLVFCDHLKESLREPLNQQKLIQPFQPYRSQSGSPARFLDLRPVNCRSQVLLSGSGEHVVDQVVTMESSQCSVETIRRVQQFASLGAIIHCDQVAASKQSGRP